MLAAPMLQNVAIISAAALLLLTCWRDLATRTLPDGVTLGIAAFGLAVQFLGGDPWLSILVALIVFALAALAWHFGALGGGDVKLLAACALLTGASGVPTLLLATSLAGGVLATVYLVGRRWPPIAQARGRRLTARVWRAERRRIGRGGPLPYALAIAVGTFAALPLSL